MPDEKKHPEHWPEKWGQTGREPWNKGMSKYASEEEKREAQLRRKRELYAQNAAEINARRRAATAAKRDITHPYIECVVCGAVFQRKRSDQKYCSKKCRKKHDAETHKEHIRAYRKAYAEKNAERIKEKRHERYWRDVEATRRQKRANYRARKEREAMGCVGFEHEPSGAEFLALNSVALMALVGVKPEGAIKQEHFTAASEVICALIRENAALRESTNFRAVKEAC